MIFFEKKSQVFGGFWDKNGQIMAKMRFFKFIKSQFVEMF